MDTVVAGSLAALSVDALIYPLDTLKTRLQTPDVDSRFPTRRAFYSGLYRGIGPVVIATLPAAAVFFSAYEGVKGKLGAGGGGGGGGAADAPLLTGPALHLTSSCVAELASCLVLAPAEIIKQRAQVATSGSSARGVFEEAVKGQGQAQERGQRCSPHSQPQRHSLGLGRTFTRGYLALAGRNIPFTALQFPLYEDFRARLSSYFGVPLGSEVHGGGVGGDGSRSGFPAEDAGFVKPGLVAALSASGAGSIAALASTPIDNAKTRIMIYSGAGGPGVDSASRPSAKSPAAPCPPVGSSGGTLRTMGELFAREGWGSLWRGGLLRSVWTAAGAGIYLGSYESGRLWWRGRQAQGTGRGIGTGRGKEVEVR